ncbi:MAG: hypothetical protein AMXMBFR13_14430 [Phycisphaerae bacterium]
MAALLFLVTLAATWQRWTVQAFPLDAGREMIIPRLLAEGRALYTDIRCFYGPLGYWIQGWLVALFGYHQDTLWWISVARFGTTLLLLGLLARQLAGPVLGPLSLCAFGYALCFTLLTPYSAAVGWGVLALTAGVYCAARQLELNARLISSNEAARLVRRRLAWAALAGLLLSLAAATKHEYAAVSAALLCVLALDGLLVRRAPGVALLQGLAGIVPFAVIAAVVVAGTPWNVLVWENLWPKDCLASYGGGLAYGPGAVIDAAKAALLLEVCGLAAAAVALFTLCFGSRRPRWPRLRVRRTGWILLAAGIIAVLTAEVWVRSAGLSGKGWSAWPKPRVRLLVECAPLLCLPICVLAGALLGRRAWRRGPRATWLRLGFRGQLAALLALGLVMFAAREIPGSNEILRQPFPPILFAWLVGLIMPRWMCWRREARRFWTAATALLLVAMTACAWDNMVFLHTRPAVMLQGSTGQTAAWQRRRPFTPAWFNEALQMVASRRPEIGAGSIACVPEGAWVNALLGLDWPTRDTQWMGYCQPWIEEDLLRRPPGHILVMEPGEFEQHLPRIARQIGRDYTAIEAGKQGMVLYRLRGGLEGVPCVR